MNAARFEPLRLYWWKGVPNFGDGLSALVVGHVSGRAVRHAGPKACEMLAIGSLIQVMRRNYGEPAPDGRRPVIWGAGLLHPVGSTGFLDNVDVALVRGPLTAELLGLKMRAFGDPGLLVDAVLGDLPARADRIALVPHHSMRDDPALAALVAGEPALDLIDVGGDTLEVCRRVAACRHVISASLHGLIVADACGVPSTWLRPGDQGLLKFYDYAASVGRPLGLPIELDEVPALLRGMKDGDRPGWSEGVDRAKSDLLSHFPAQLRASTDTVRTSVRA
ncbi:polysaccharide pyruvyl transferase family protein [Ruegeria marina]|uniref:Polysaccharide pyruvyl transferase n=1 Tax=Ruegeria marina TaxID=639004 RepID=A0A1G6Q397_9RHOB|nr:polysaccharide pyruvyl transferase family protein [Ruegeria marina]SDC86932.1 Polysaccharide pyruvyl transferase [Ruegeria marina]